MNDHNKTLRERIEHLLVGYGLGSALARGMADDVIATLPSHEHIFEDCTCDEPGCRREVCAWCEYVRERPSRKAVEAKALRDAAAWKREHNLGNDVWHDYLGRLAEEKYQAGGDDMITIWLENRADQIEADHD